MRGCIGRLVLGACVAAGTCVADPSARAADADALVAKTHAASLALRREALRKTIARDTCWPGGVWGDNLWCLAALYLNEKTDEANARLLARAKDYIASNPASTSRTSPDAPGNLPWTFFSITDYVRALYLFRAKSPYFPGRLKAETEAAMKEALWRWVCGESRVAETGPDDLLLLLGTENHDLNRRPAYYLVTALLQDDPAYHDRALADGRTIAEHAAAYTSFFREWPRKRVATGLWVEVGSTTYQKYSWPALFNLHELSPDPLIRERFGQLLDLAFIEEEQISVRGRRGGGKSRAYAGANPFEPYKNLLFAADGLPAGSSHSRVIETSRYQLPPEAILLRSRAFPATNAFAIRNRVLGELASPKRENETSQRLAADAALVNYAWRTPHYLLGSTLQDPTRCYAGISCQNRVCGMIFDNPAAAGICSVQSVIEHGGGGRPQHSFWSVQHENVLILQRIAARKDGLGSYSTGRVGIRFDGPGFERVEEDGWIFASDGQAYLGVRFLDGGHRWDEKRVEAYPARFGGAADTTRILLHAGDVAGDGDFEHFRAAVRACPLTVTADAVDYRFGAQRIEMQRYDAAAPQTFVLPRINGSTIDLHPTDTYHSPFLNGAFGSDRITVSVGAAARVLDFAEEGGNQLCPPTGAEKVVP